MTKINYGSNAFLLTSSKEGIDGEPSLQFQSSKSTSSEKVLQKKYSKTFAEFILSTDI
jgi:hypothetical protein